MRRIFFCHIPKTAGMSFMSALSSLYDTEDVSASRLLTHLQAESHTIKDKLLIGGHFGVKDVGEELLKDYYKVTFVRDPVERILSLYYYWNSHAGRYGLTRDEDPNYDGVQLAIQGNLKEFLSTNHPRIIEEISNTQCRYIIGSPKEKLINMSDQEIFEAAKSSLERHFSFVGLVEKYEAGIRRLGKDIPAFKELQIETINKNPRPSSDTVDQALIHKIRNINQADIMLHEYISEKYAQNPISEKLARLKNSVIQLAQ